MKGNTECHIPNAAYRDNYDAIFRKPTPKVYNLRELARVAILSNPEIKNYLATLAHNRPLEGDPDATEENTTERP